MTVSEAAKYANMLEVLSDYEALILCDYMFEDEEYRTIEELAQHCDMSERKVRDLCYDLEKLGVFREDLIYGLEKYNKGSGDSAYFVEKIINIFD